MPKKIFISYRRDDSAGHAGRVYDRLQHEFGRDVLFIDVDNLPLGKNFARILSEEVSKCDVLLAIIGPNWLNARDEEGSRRLDNPHDFVRIEIAAALQRDIPVIPILLEGAKVPKPEQLPDNLKELLQRNGLDVRHASFHSDMDKLVRALKGRLLKRRAEVERARGQDGEKTVFVSYPKDIAPELLKQLGSALIKGGFRLWLYDPRDAGGFPDEELEKISWQQSGVEYEGQRLLAARGSDAILFLISSSTLENQVQKNELSIALTLRNFVPCIVDDALEAKQLPEEMRQFYFRKLTQKRLSDEVTFKMLVRDVASAAARKKRPPTTKNVTKGAMGPRGDS